MANTITNLSEEKGTPFNIRLTLLKYVRYWYFFLLSIALALGGAYWYLRYTIPVYQISALILIKDHPQNTSDEILKQGGPPKADKVVENEIELLKSSGQMLHVVDDLNLTVSYFKQGKIRSDEEMYGNSPIWIYARTPSISTYQKPFFIKILNKQQYELQDQDGQGKGKYTFSQTIKSDYGTFSVFLNDSLYHSTNNLVKVVFYNRERVAQRYKSTLKVVLLNPNSTVLKLTLEDAIPARGKAVLGKLLETYTYSALKDKNLEATNTIKFIDERLRLITDELNNVERNVESYKSAESITDLSEEGNMFLGNVNVNDAKINEVDIQLEILNSVENYLNNSKNGLAPASLSDPILTDLLKKLNDLQIQQDKYSRTMEVDNPFLKPVNAQIANIKTSIKENIANQRQNLLINRANFQQLNKRFTSAIRTIPRKEREFLTIKRQQGIKESLYLLLLQKKEETAIAYASSVTDSRIIDEPNSSSYPLKPNNKNIYLVAFLAGLLIPIGGISLQTLLSDKVQTRKQIEDELGVRVFGEIMKKPKELKDYIIDIKNNRVIAEQFKVLRANLPYTNGNVSPISGQIMLVTSSTFGEGKSFFSTNLAFNLAQLNKRVIILELDLRNPKTSDYLGMPKEQDNGISTYLNNQSSLPDISRPTNLHPNLYLISSGPLPANPAELLSNGRIGILLEELRQQFDYIILDTPPIAFVADTIILGPYADTVFYIVRQGYTSRNHMQLLAGLEASQKIKSLHVIFNGVEYEKSKVLAYEYTTNGKLN